MIPLLVALYTLVITARAEFEYGYGLGVSQSARRSIAEVKAIHAGYRDQLAFGFVHQVEIGAWFDSAGQGRRSGAFGAYSLGLEVDVKPVLLRATHGLAVITAPDSYLGGPFPQFNNGVYAGIKDRRGNSIGIQYRHISSAGIFNPNIGRDFIEIEIGFDW